MKIITRQEIEAILPSLDLVPLIEAGFVAYSAGRAVIPPVGELLLDNGDVHIKYGYLRQDDYYVIKIASGFYDNAQFGLPTSNGLMLLFRQQTGELQSVLLDEGRLTDIRTAVAGAIAAKYLAPLVVERIGIVGTGIQAHLQLQHLAQVTSCRDVLVWDRTEPQREQYREELARSGFQVEMTAETAEIMGSCNLIVTCTPATEPLLMQSDLRPGTHITAVGADTPHKQEVDGAILGQADVVVADSIAQCLVRGEIHQAIKNGFLAEADIVELGSIIEGTNPGRKDQNQITIADLTGVAVQDIQISKAVYEAAAAEDILSGL
jgi:ornithine cyclodeaminase